MSTPLRRAILLVIIAVATGCLWFVVSSASHKLIIRTYFQHAQGLIPGARVRVDGVEVGFVREVSVETGRRSRPVAVVMALDGRNGLSVPFDATASLRSEGAIGPAFIEIDAHNKTGAPIGDDGILESD